jgi:hypothetical protein
MLHNLTIFQISTVWNLLVNFMNKEIVLSRLLDQKSVKKKYKRNLEKKEKRSSHFLGL